MPHLHRASARLATGLLVTFAACGGSSAPGSNSGLEPGQLALNPVTGGLFMVEANHGGQASSVALEHLLWGRLVDLHDTRPSTGEPSQQPLFRDLLVDPFATSDGIDLVFDVDPATGRELVTVLHGRGSAAFAQALERLEAGLVPVQDKGLSPTELPPYPVWPRNAAMALVFDDVLDDGGDPGAPGYPGSVNGTTTGLQVGYPPEAAQSARILPDPNHGDLVGGQFHTTRVLIDPAVSTFEASESGLVTNPSGLPAAVAADQPNVALRLATRIDPLSGQLQVLRNLSGHVLDSARSGPLDLSSPTLDVVRALRSGSGTLGDVHNGFLPDEHAPHLVGIQSVSAANVVALADAEFELDLTFSNAACAPTPKTGDVILLVSSTLIVSADAASPVGGVAQGVRVRVRSGQPSPAAGLGQYRAPFEARADQDPGCFVLFSGGASQPPLGGIDPSTAVTLHFDEPLDPDSLTLYDGFRLTELGAAPPGSPERTVVGGVSEASDLQRFTFSPALPLSHVQGSAESVRIEASTGAFEARDLAGNPLVASLPELTFTLDPGAASLDTGGVALTFAGTDEDGNGAPELRGQVVFDLARGTLQPRAVSRQSALLDTSGATSPTVQAWTPLFGFPEPLSEYGSVVQSVWRYHDMGFGLMDEGTINLDVEGLAWQPESGGVTIDHFPEFEIALTHSNRLPDEWVDPATGGIFYPTTGLTNDFESNRLEEETVVHPRSRGYLITPNDVFQATSGQVLAPWPLNRGMAPEEFEYFTFRDTSIQTLGGPNGQGVDTLTYMMTTGTGETLYGAGEVPSIGLPLMMEYRTWPHDGAFGTNRVLKGMANLVGLPYFQSWSGGFVSDTGETTLVDPTTAQKANGGVDPAGNSIPGTDIGVIFGQVDFVVRVSRAHTVWFDTGSASQFTGATFDPPQFDQPAGTDVRVAFRGASMLSDSGLASDADNLDPYGDPLAGLFGVQFLNGDATWKDDVSELSGARFIQARITLTSNAATSITPEISSLSLSYFK